VGNFTGTGYIVEDPQTGAAFYEISGGRQGGGAQGATSPTPLPQFPANAAATITMSAALRGTGAAVVVKEGSIVGIALPRLAATLSLGTAAALMGALAVGMLIGSSIAAAQARAIEERYPPASRVLRHYTRLLFVPLITGTEIILGSTQGTFGPGVYFEEPPNQAISCPPTPVESAAITALYQLPLNEGETPFTRATGIVDLEITRAGYWDPIIIHPNAIVPSEAIIPLLFVYFGPGAVAIRLYQSCPG